MRFNKQLIQRHHCVSQCVQKFRAQCTTFDIKLLTVNKKKYMEIDAKLI